MGTDPLSFNSVGEDCYFTAIVAVFRWAWSLLAIIALPSKPLGDKTSSHLTPPLFVRVCFCV